MTNLRLNHDFFQLISGRSAIRSKELVKEELSANKTKLLEGLLSYKKPSANSALKLKGDKSIGKPELNFCVRLSKFLDLDECQSQHLFESFLIHGFRGSAKQLQAILKDERSVQALLLKVWDYYQTERIQLLHCLKQVLSFCEELGHPYNAVYLECLQDLQRQKLIDKLFAQYEDRCQAVAPNKLDVGPPMTDRQSLKWSLQCLREQCELLEIILLYFKSFEATEKRILSLIKLFQKQGFGTRQTNKHLYDGDTTADQLMNRLGFNCCLIILECLDLYHFLGETTHERTSKHKLVSCKETFNDLNKLVGSLGNIIHYGPLILAWTSLHAAAFPDKDPEFVQRLGQSALQLQVFQYLYTMLNLAPFSSDAVLSPLSHTIVYGLLNLVLSVFDEQTLGSTHILVHLTCQLLEQKHLCETFWEEDVDGGMAMLLHSATMKFPMEFSPLLQLLKAMATSGTKKVYEYLNHLPHFTELLDNNKADEIKSMKQAGIWTRVTDKILFLKADGSNSFVIPALTTGVIFEQNTGDHLIRWDYEYSGWFLFSCQMENFLESIIQGLGSETQGSQNRSIVELVGHMLKSNWSISANFKPIIQQIYRFIQQLSSLPHPPLQLITSCLDCITTVAEHNSQEVWKELQLIGFLPHTGNLYTEVAKAASGDGIFPGHYGNLLHRHEQPSGVYPVTLSCLNLLHQLVKGLSSVNVDVAVSQDLLAIVVFMQREVFTVFHKWRCNVFSDRETIGQKCLEIFHIILNTAQRTNTNQTQKSRGVTLRETCIHGFLNFESGQALLNIVSTGVDAIDQRATENGCTFAGPVERLTQLIKLAFSVLNRLMIWQPANHEPSPMEQVLTSHTTGLPHQPHLVALIAGYIYHKFDPRLPTLATLLLKRLALVAPMSVYGCLGNHAIAIRDTYLYRLQSHSEDARLRVVILEFLSSAVESQPGLIEMFLNLNFKEKKTTVAPGKKGDKTKTKQPVAAPRRLTAAFPVPEDQFKQFIQAPPIPRAAKGRLREDQKLSSTSKALFSNKAQGAAEEALAFVDRAAREGIRAVNGAGSALEKGLQDVLKKFNHEQKYKIWSQIIREMMENRAGEEDDAEDLFIREDEGLILLQAWRMFLLVLSSSPPSDQIKIIVLNDLIASIKSQVVATMSTFHVRACLLLGSVYLSLLKRWTSLHGDQWNKLIDLIFITEHLTDEDLKSFIRLRVLMLSSITVLLQYQRGKNPKALEDTTISRLLSIICSSLRHSKMYYQRAVPTTTKVLVKKSTIISEKEIVESVEKRSQIKLEKKSEQLPIVGVYMLDELILSVDTENLWLPMIRQHSVLALLLSTVQACMESMKGLDYVESVLLLFLDIAAYPEAAEALQVTGLIHHICLPLSRVYSNSVPQTPKFEKTESVTWLGIYRISLSLMTGMITTLKHSFLSDALSFFGVHHDRMQQCLQAVESNYSTSCQKEAERTMEFIFQLSRFFKEWRFQMPQAVQQVQARVCCLCHQLVALLMRPRLLQHLIEFDKKGGKEDKQQMNHSMGSLARLQHQTSTDDFDTPSAELQAVQSELFTILGNGLAALRHFTPDFLEILCSPIIDVSEFPLLFALAFTSPTVDHDSPPSFGSLVACINTCVRFLSKLEGVRSTSPIRSPSKSPQARLVPLKDSPIQRSVVMFVLESALFLIMSQCLRYLKEPSSVGQRDKQLLKRELGSELETFLHTLQRLFRRGGSVTSPSAASSSPLLTTPSTGKSSLHHGSFTDTQEQAYFNLVRQFVKQILR
ncbi:nucleoporin NUP188 homolog [Anneissia japonica]|uniref:nucleoporin NUP188 homolog n=1 Tax=Anneissia japonica TaxID=1529436 RepID=UPI0014259185|nr:nucleoporin NUP188 homolog [Anneissia japonica]